MNEDFDEEKRSYFRRRKINKTKRMFIKREEHIKVNKERENQINSEEDKKKEIISKRKEQKKTTTKTIAEENQCKLKKSNIKTRKKTLNQFLKTQRKEMINNTNCNIKLLLFL